MRRLLLLPVVLAVAACNSGEGPLMLPGEDCISCHGGSVARALDAPTWTLAGTAYVTPDADPLGGVEGALVHVQDAAGTSFALRTNLAGNFYTSESVVFPLQVCVERGGATRCMQNVTQGSCNYCHTIPSRNHAPGRVTAP